MPIHNSSKESFTCKICGRSYAHLAALKIHSITHSSEKPFQCNLCDKKFKRNQELKVCANTLALYLNPTIDIYKVY